MHLNCRLHSLQLDKLERHEMGPDQLSMCKMTSEHICSVQAHAHMSKIVSPVHSPVSRAVTQASHVS